MWWFIMFGALLSVGAAMVWLELRNLDTAHPQKRLLSGACIRCGRNSENAWCPDCVDYLGITL